MQNIIRLQTPNPDEPEPKKSYLTAKTAKNAKNLIKTFALFAYFAVKFLPKKQRFDGLGTNHLTTKPPHWFRWRSQFEALLVPVVLTLMVLLWQMIIWLGDYASFILPSPAKVAETFGRALADGTLWLHTRTTLSEVLTGLALGLTSATILGYFLAKNHVIERLVAPYIVASQSVPVVAIAPLLVIWFGTGLLSKVLICALVVFFPVLVNTVIGIRAVDEDLRDLMRSLRASKWQMFYLLDLPAALPVLLGGLKVGVTLSVIGAVVGEFVVADQGLGFLLNHARGLFKTPLVFVAIFSLVGIALILYGLVALLEAWLLRWRN